MVQIRWNRHVEEAKGEEDTIRRGLSKPQPMAVTNMHAAFCSAQNKLHFNKERRPLHVFSTCEFYNLIIN